MSDPYPRPPAAYGQYAGAPQPAAYGQPTSQEASGLPGAPAAAQPYGGPAMHNNGNPAVDTTQTTAYDAQRAGPHTDVPPPYGQTQPSTDPYSGQKRSREDEYGANKRPAMDEARPGETETVFRFLCDGKKLGAVMGQGGANISRITQNTGARIHCLVDGVPGCDEKIIIISGPVAAQQGNPFNPAQLALFEIFDIVLSLDHTMPSMGGPFLRMLMCHTQAGSLIGKSGVIIKEMKDKSGCQNIKVLQPEDLPPCAIANDKLLHITGNPDSLRSALRLTTERLRDSPPKEMPSHEPCQNAFFNVSRTGGSAAQGGPPQGPPGMHGAGGAGAGPPNYRNGPPGVAPGSGAPPPYRGGNPAMQGPPGRTNY